MKISDESIISALLSCSTNRQAAQKCGLSENRLYERMREPEFKRKLADAKAQMLERTTAMMQSHLTEAAETMVEIMTNKENAPQVRLNAADALLRNGLRLTEQTDVVAQLRELERESD